MIWQKKGVVYSRARYDVPKSIDHYACLVDSSDKVKIKVVANIFDTFFQQKYLKPLKRFCLWYSFRPTLIIVDRNRKINYFVGMLRNYNFKADALYLAFHSLSEEEFNASYETGTAKLRRTPLHDSTQPSFSGGNSNRYCKHSRTSTESPFCIS